MAADPESNGRILLVDDDPMVRRVGERMIGLLHFDVTTAAGGEEALERFREAPGAFRLVLMDLSMPGMSGQDAWRRMREIHPGVKVLFVSGYSEAEGLTELEREEVGFVQKPYRLDDLRKKLSEILDD